jgi:hypothetical protein
MRIEDLIVVARKSLLIDLAIECHKLLIAITANHPFDI